MSLSKRIAVVGLLGTILLGLCFPFGSSLWSQANVGSDAGEVAVRESTLFPDTPPDLYEHLGWLDAAFFECGTGKGAYQVQYKVDVWVKGEPFEPRVWSDRFLLNDGDERLRFDSRVSISVQNEANRALEIRGTQVSPNARQPMHPIVVPVSLFGYAVRRESLRSAVLEPDEEKIVWLLSLSKNHDARGYTLTDGSIDVSRRAEADILITLTLRLTPWLAE